ncbi:MAG: peptidylprolyl isomerase [Sphaerobacter sp.]|nr:peptidylprolyl isomerase [Sphaerobacter sp.]
MREQLRQWFGSGRSRSATAQRWVSRRQREEFRQRLLLVGIAVAAVLVVLILVTGAIYQYLYLPNQTLVTVNGAKISRGDYWKMRKLELLNQVQQYSQIAQFASGQQRTQYQQLAEQARARLDTVESDPVDTQTVNQMVDDQVLLQRLDTLGLTLTDADVDQVMEQFFSPAPQASPTPTLGVDPTAAAWATATAEAQVTPTPTPEASPTATVEATASPTGDDENATVSGTPAAEDRDTTAPGTPAVTPAAPPSPTATPNPDEARATATATFEQYKRNVLDTAGMSEADFRRLVVRPEAARQKVVYHLQSAIPQRGEQVHAAHILVATEAAALAIAEELRSGADFATVAKEKSADTATAPNGGDLGWFPRGVMVAPFEEAAFRLPVGEISQPVQTEFGWHIIKVLDHEQDRPLDVNTLQTLRNRAFTKWLEEQRAASTIEWHIAAPSPTPTSTEFVPPPAAPPTPTPTPSPTPTLPPSTPGAGETPEPTATP